MSLSTRQVKLYTDTATVYRATENRAGTGKPGARTWTAVYTALPCYLQTGESVKAPIVFINSEQDNLFTYDILHVEAGTVIKAGDIVKMTGGAQTGDYYHVRGDDKIRARRANKLSLRVSREPTPPAGVP